MEELFGNLSFMEKIYVVCAFVGTLLFIIRLLLQFIGHTGDAGGDVGGFHDASFGDAHGGDFHDGSDFSFKLLTFQGLTAFFMMFGLVGLAFSKGSGVGAIAALIGALAAGVGSVWLIGKLFVYMTKLQSSGNVEPQNAVGGQGTVYLRIPPKGTGKVHVNVNERLRELDAVADDESEIATGENIRVIRVMGNVVVVQKIDN